MGSQVGILACAVAYFTARAMDITLPTWAMLAVYIAAGWLQPLFFPDKSVGKVAPPLDDSIVMLQGERPKIGGDSAKVVVVERWATWCPPCVASIPHLNALYDKYNGRVEFVGVTDETDTAKIKVCFLDCAPCLLFSFVIL